jgi:CHAT domain-containing protein/tetratricopeptide (TPR) repeat protein
VMRSLAALTATLLVAIGCGVRVERDVLRTYRAKPTREQLGHPTWLADGTSNEVAGSLSPDGTQLLYADNSKGQFDITLKDLTTGLPRRLTRHVAEDTQPSWSPDGKSVVFVSRREDAKGDIFIWRDDALRRLTDSRSADDYPVFGPSGAIYFASGAMGRSRIERLEANSGRRSAVTDWNATHPAISPDGRFLAYTWFDEQQRGQIRLERLADKREWTVTTRDYHAGFPAFSADGGSLLFCRFVRGAPDVARDPEAIASLWRLPLAQIVGDRDATRPLRAEQLMERAEQLTSDRRGVLLPRPHRRGIVVTVKRLAGLDIGLLPTTGLLPNMRDADRLADLARQQIDPWDELFVLRHLRQRSRQHAAAASYREVQLLRRVGELHKAKHALEALIGRHPGTSEAKLAQIDRLALPLAYAQRERDARSARKIAKATLEPLLKLAQTSTTARVQAYALLRAAEMQRLLEQRAVALAIYQRIERRFGDQRELAARARLQSGELLESLPTPRMLAEYYLTLFDDYPKQRATLDRAALAALDQISGPAAHQIAELRQLLERHPGKKLFCARAALRLATLHEQVGASDLAIRALDDGIASYGVTDALTAQLAFRLGRLALEVSAELRAKGRAGEALSFFDRALVAYERIVQHFEPATETHQRARRAYLRLSLLDAAQRRREGEHAIATRRYQVLLRFDDELLQAHRGLAQLQTAAAGGAERRSAGRSPAEQANARVDALLARYRQHRSRFVRAYMTGYLSTLYLPLDAGHLEQAETALQQALALRPQNPFTHMTLGWVYEMSERYLEQTDRGWLEEAVIAYDRAYALNDARLDPQTEADLLINLSNTFAALGSGWDEVLDACRRRRELDYPFDSRAQEALHQLTCGRAASARGAHDRATERLERALELAKQMRRAGLETEVLARLALNEHLRGDYERSNQLFERVRTRLAAGGQSSSLVAIDRTVAYNALLAGDHARALELLSRANETLRSRGVARVPSFETVAAKSNPSTLPLGLGPLAERYAQRTLAEVAEQKDERPDRAFEQQAAALRLLAQRVKENPSADLRRELLVARNRHAAGAVRLDQPAAFWTQIEAALRETALTDDDGQALSSATFTLTTGLALNASTQLLHELRAGNDVAPARLEATYRRLVQLEELDLDRARRGEQRLPERARLHLWSALARLSTASALGYARALAGAATAERKPPAVGSAEASRSDASARGAQALNSLMQRARPLTEVIERLERVIEQAATGPSPAESSEAALRPDASLSAPLEDAERWRWRLAATLNLARLSTPWVAADRLDQHPSTARLQELRAARPDSAALGPLADVLAGELAFRQRDGEELQRAVSRFVARHPLLLTAAQLRDVDSARRWLFERAIALALQQQRAGDALALAEVAERHAFVVDLVRLGPRGGSPLVRSRLQQLLRQAASYRALDAIQPEDGGSSQTKQDHAAQRAAVRKRLEQSLDALRSDAPGVGALLHVGEFPLAGVRELLEPEDSLVRAVHDGAQVALIALTKTGDVRAAPLELPLRSLRQQARLGTRALSLVAAAIEALELPAGRLYLDLGAIDPTLTDRYAGHGRAVVRLASAWELLDARLQRNVALGHQIVVAGRSSASGGVIEGQAPKASAGGSPIIRLVRNPLDLSHLERETEQGGALLLDCPVEFAGGSAANVVVSCGDRAEHAWRPAYQLGQPLRAAVIALPKVAFGPTRARRQRVALLRLLHALGIASIVLPGRQAADPKPTIRALIATQSRSLPDAIQRDGLLLFGDAGVAPDARKAVAEEALKAAVFAGARAFNAKPRQLAKTISQLEKARLYMSFSGQSKFLGGALLYLANAYGLRENYPLAIRRMKRLVDLRAEELATLAQQGTTGKGLLKAKAQYVTALRQMAWLRLRNEEFDAALEANAKSIQIYREVGREELLRSAFDQRSIINEQKGDWDQSLHFAQKNLEIARRRATRDKATAKQRQVAASAATRVARLQRLRFSRFDAAMAAVREALAFAPQPSGDGAPAQAKEAIALRRDALLELARVQSARGTFSEAVATAERTLALLTDAGLATDSAELELVNNLYYMGAYPRALAVAKRGLSQSTESPRRTVQFLNARGTVLAAIGRYEASRRALERALTIARRQKISREIAATENNIGNTERLAGRHRAALRRFNVAWEIDTREGDKLGLSFSLANRGLAHAMLDLPAEAREDLERARTLAEEIGAPLNRLKALAGLARLALTGQDYDVALRRAEGGLALARKLGLRNWVWRFQLQAGRAHLGQGDQDKAAELFRAGVELIDTRPPRPQPMGSTALPEEQPRELYEELIDLRLAKGDAREALELVRRLHARVFADLHAAELQAVTNEQVRKGLEELRRLHEAREAMLSGKMRPSDTAARAEADATLQHNERALADSRAKLRQVNPRLLALVEPDVAPRNRIDAAISALPDTSAVAVYFATPRRLAIWLLTPQTQQANLEVAGSANDSSRGGARVQLVAVDVHRRALHAAVKQLHRRLERFARPGDVLDKLSDWLVRPLLEQTTAKRIYLLCGGFLRSVPFAALRAGGEPLVDSRTIVYLSRLADLLPAGDRAESGVEALASRSVEDRSKARRKDRSKAGHWVSFSAPGPAHEPLPFGGYESAALGRSFELVQVFQREEATRTAFAGAAPGAAQLHVATHARFDRSAPLRSGLELSDGRFSLGELVGLPISSRLVLLSACETGRSPALDTAGIFGIDRAWLVAGARAAISSLWRVDDLAAALLIKQLVRRLADGVEPASALREAQQQLRAERPHPAFWAAFRAIGPGLVDRAVTWP